MIKYIKLIILFSFLSGQLLSGSFIINININNRNPTYIKNDFNIKTKNLSNLFYLNNYLNDLIIKGKMNIKNRSINNCNSNYKNHDIERFNKMMVYQLENTPECLLSFYSSLEYGR